MTAKANPSSRGITAIVVATAAVTLAIGVTVAALGGYLAPRPEPLAEQLTPPGPPVDVLDAQAEAPAVVLVPVTPRPPLEQPRSPPAWAEPEPVLAAHEPAGYDEDDDEDHDDRARGRHEHEPEEHDEDDGHDDHDD